MSQVNPCRIMFEVEKRVRGRPWGEMTSWCLRGSQRWQYSWMQAVVRTLAFDLNQVRSHWRVLSRVAKRYDALPHQGLKQGRCKKWSNFKGRYERTGWYIYIGCGRWEEKINKDNCPKQLEELSYFLRWKWGERNSKLNIQSIFIICNS